MNWFIRVIGSSIGKKLMMSVTGLCFICFLAVHLGGNMTLYANANMFNAYAEHLHSYGPLITIAEWGLLALAVIHICTGLYLFYQNLSARPTRYAVNKRAGGRTIGSITMPYTGILILIFLVIHLLNFHFADRTGTTIYNIVFTAFQQPATIVFYILMMVVVAVHISHGLWSAIQTIGANHVKYMPLVMVASIGIAVIFGIGFGFIPIYLNLGV